MRLSTFLAGSLLGFSCLSAVASSQPAAGEPTPEQFAHARELAQSAMIIDTHVDVPYRLKEEWEDVTQSTAKGNFDYPRARQGGLDIPFMSIYTPSSTEADGSAFQLANELIDSMEALVGRAPDRFVVVRSPDEARAAKAAGKIGIAFGMENGSPVKAKLQNIQYFHDRGVRYITLAHSMSNHISDSSYDKNRQWNGLSPFGREVIEEMNRLGIMVDISHVSDEAFYDVLEVTRAPVIASHSSARHFTPGFERNMSDEMIVALAKNGGVIQINYGSSFLTAAANQWFTEMGEARTAWMQETGNEQDSEAGKAWAKAYRDERPLPFASLSDVADHIDHVVKLVGHEHVGIGSDFDGVGDSLPEGLKDVTSYPALIAELLRRGYTDEQLVAILGGNTLRVWSEVEEYARRHAAGQWLEQPSAPSVGMANPAAVYCQYLGGKTVAQTTDGGAKSTLCQLPDGQSCEQWALYRGSCSLDAEISKPFEFCSAISNTPVLPVPAAGSRPLLPSALLPSMRAQGLAKADQPPEVQLAARWRCMEQAVYVCPIGANLPCEEPANLGQAPSQALKDFCAATPDTDTIPAYVTGRATVYSWSCKGGEATPGEQLFHADAQGYLAEFWHKLQQR
ncbi:MAG TPA: membrane dipeptidase [Xanthomonadales bacterium]|nr:membrane dipeptidase [Xanthomonadales bacterium]